MYYKAGYSRVIMKTNTEKRRTRDEIVREWAKCYVELSTSNIIGTLKEFKNCSLYVLAAEPTVLAKVRPEFLPRQIRLLCEQKENCALLGSRQRVLAIPYRRFRKTYRSHLQRSRPFFDSWPLNMGPIGCPETSVRNWRHSLRNNSEERSFHLLHGRSLKSRRLMFVETKFFGLEGYICPDVMENYMLRISR
jgi:hypothetical protein